MIVLDISGSMGCGISQFNAKSEKGNRLNLAKEAIKMFYSKLRTDDAFGLVVFDTVGETVIPCTKKSELEEEAVFELVESIQTRGGTTLFSGFNEGANNIGKYINSISK